MPCESGDGRVSRGAAELVEAVVIVAVVVAVAEVVETEEVGREGEREAPGRIDVAVEVEEVDDVRW